MARQEAQPDRIADRAGERLVVLGRVGRAQGIRGWVRLHSYTEPRDALLGYRNCRLYRDGEWLPATLVEGALHGKALIARFDGVDDRDEAEGLVGADIGVPRDELPDPGEGHYYWADLEGSTVRHTDGRELGTVAYLVATGAHDVLVVRGEREILIPFVPHRVILDVDLEGKEIRVDWEWD